MKQPARIIAVVALFCAGFSPGVGARELSLAEAMKAAERNSPRLKASQFQERAAHEGIGVAQSAYYPSVAADAIDSWGFPGSSGYLGIGGLMGSSYRSGAAAGLVARDTLFDFGRTYANVKGARSAEKARHEAIAVDRNAIDRDVLQTFYECSRFRSEREVWTTLHDETELVAKEIARFVDIGQRSVVDRYLSQAQVEEASTNRNFFKSRMNSTASRLALLMGTSGEDLSCPALPKIDYTVPIRSTDLGNPYIRKAQTEVELARDRLFSAKTDYLPKIVGVASTGTMEKARLVNRTDYSGGLGIVVPLFDGLGTVHRVAQTKAEFNAKTQELAAVQLETAELDARLNEVIDASKARIEHLEQEQQLAQEGFRIAKRRYFKFQGTLADLRDSLRNLGRIETEMIDTQANLLEAAGDKALLAGGRP